MLVTIFRDRWSRSTNLEYPYLLDEDGNRSIVGHYLHQAGVPDELLLNRIQPVQWLPVDGNHGAVVSAPLPGAPEWLTKPRGSLGMVIHGDVGELLDIDRLHTIDDDGRVIWAKRVFRRHGVGVRFVDSMGGVT